ncbi:hypothetical protein I6B53_01305 [Schaalia sp. 19OD2882]|uniref:hypothetical protein n=1 Tax=Schaalia sp. 19OD2882 TaxID=2794089 RepID=UPI001C1EB116|nr:hypothetical protein [Schaalia sp. 19OD2882]QWW19800.1 hypothetical protein I6B53_01305 [Schaalia sp. 19OD2882]
MSNLFDILPTRRFITACPPEQSLAIAREHLLGHGWILDDWDLDRAIDGEGKWSGTMFRWGEVPHATISAETIERFPFLLSLEWVRRQHDVLRLAVAGKWMPTGDVSEVLCTHFPDVGDHSTHWVARKAELLRPMESMVVPLKRAGVLRDGMETIATGQLEAPNPFNMDRRVALREAMRTQVRTSH